jgi:hypothetical protein
MRRIGFICLTALVFACNGKSKDTGSSPPDDTDDTDTDTVESDTDTDTDTDSDTDTDTDSDVDTDTGPVPHTDTDTDVETDPPDTDPTDPPPNDTADTSHTGVEPSETGHTGLDTGSGAFHTGPVQTYVMGFDSGDFDFLKLRQLTVLTAVHDTAEIYYKEELYGPDTDTDNLYEHLMCSVTYLVTDVEPVAGCEGCDYAWEFRSAAPYYSYGEDFSDTGLIDCFNAYEPYFTKAGRKLGMGWIDDSDSTQDGAAWSPHLVPHWYAWPTGKGSQQSTTYQLSDDEAIIKVWQAYSF